MTIDPEVAKLLASVPAPPEAKCLGEWEYRESYGDYIRRFVVKGWVDGSMRIDLGGTQNSRGTLYWKIYLPQQDGVTLEAAKWIQSTIGEALKLHEDWRTHER